MSVCPTLPSSTSPPFEARFIVASTNLLAVLHHRQPPASLLSSDGYQLLDPTSPPSSSAPAPDTHSTLPDRSIISSIAASRAVDLIAFVRVAPASHRIVTIATLDRSHSLDLDLDHSTASSVHLHWHPALPVLLIQFARSRVHLVHLSPMPLAIDKTFTIDHQQTMQASTWLSTPEHPLQFLIASRSRLYCVRPETTAQHKIEPINLDLGEQAIRSLQCCTSPKRDEDAAGLVWCAVEGHTAFQMPVSSNSILSPSTTANSMQVPSSTLPPLILPFGNSIGSSSTSNSSRPLVQLLDTPDEPQPSLIIQSAASSNSAITLDTLIETAPAKSARLLLLSLSPRSSSIVLEHRLDSVVVPDILAVCELGRNVLVASHTTPRAVLFSIQHDHTGQAPTIAESQLISLESNQRIKGACFTARSSQLHLLVVQRPAGRPASFATLNRQDTAIEYIAELRSYACLRSQDSEPQQPLPSPEPGQSQSDGSLLQEILLLQQQLLHRMTGLESRFDSFVSQFNQRMSALETQIATPDHR